MIPFLLGVPPKRWGKKAEPLGVDSIMLLMPDPERFSLNFTDGTAADWAAGSASAIWNIREGSVLWAEGLHTRASLQAQGKPLWAFLPPKVERSRNHDQR